MPPILALFLTFTFIYFLYRREPRNKAEVSNAIWIPLLWFLITGSMFVSQWLAILGVHLGETSIEDGSPIDRVVFFSLILCGVYVLNKRRVTIEEFSRHNRLLTFFLVYCFIAILWSDFPFVAAKRWIKILGHPIMVLVILTEANPIEAVRRVLKRAAYVLVPMSILFIKYFPQYGRGFDAWTGVGFNRGVTLNKNELGYGCMIFGLFFFWNTLLAFRIKNRMAKRKELLLSIAFFGMIWWLLRASESATSLLAMLIGIATMVVLGLPFINKRYIGMYVLFAVFAVAAAEPFFGIYAHVLQILGRDPTLTDRTQVWHAALKLVENPILGAGFESFWLGSRLDKLGEIWWWQPNQAHNGYIETYLNLGWAGIAILAILIVGTFQKIRLDLLKRLDFGRFRLGCLFAILAYNFTEATFKGVHLVWTLFYLIAIDYPIRRKSRPVKLPAPARPENETPNPRPVASETSTG
ncbi:MAG: O-antigen ligase family protein [Verrucomicrobia bacterium]|nr:O-antigen ligase family protein [Verrucomicrobiota bacterium]